MPDPRPVALAVVLVAWFALSVANQMARGRWTLRVRTHLPFGVVPSWTFFAPNPARSDHRLVWRDERDGTWGGWQEVVLPAAPAARRALVNHESIPPKALSDLVSAIAHPVTDDDRSWILGASYLTLLAIVVGRERAPGAAAVQFAVLRTRWVDGGRRVDVSFLSDEHALDPVDAG